MELGVPTKLIDERVGHEDGSVQGRYTHVTPAPEDLTGLWEAALAHGGRTHPASPVRALDWLLRTRWEGVPGSEDA